MEEQNPTQAFHPTASTGKRTFSVIITFSIRDKNFLWTCQRSSDCWSLICSTKMEQISLLSAVPKAEKLGFSLHSSYNQNVKSWGSSPYSSSPQWGRQLELKTNSSTNKAEQRPSLNTKFSSPYPYWSEREEMVFRNMMETRKHPHLLFSSLWATSSSFYKVTSKPPLTCVHHQRTSRSQSPFQSWQSCSFTIGKLNTWSQLKNTGLVMHF